MKHLKKFETYDIYDKLKNMLALPNVFYCMNTNEVYYNNNADFIIKYAVESNDPVQLYFYNDEITESIPFFSYGVDAFNNIEIDGVNVSITDLDKNKGKYVFTSGEHTVKYILKKQIIGITVTENQPNIGALFTMCNNIKDVIINISNDIIFGGSVFTSCTNLINVTIINNITSIGEAAFFGCSGLTSITIPDSVTNISSGAFYDCSNLVNITVNSITPPILYTGSASGEPLLAPPSFGEYSSDLKIYVPVESVEIYKVTEGWSNYADKIQAIPSK